MLQVVIEHKKKGGKTLMLQQIVVAGGHMVPEGWRKYPEPHSTKLLKVAPFFKGGGNP